nr:uncharacterized protein LOC124495578 [Dermatophagoides farinae]
MERSHRTWLIWLVLCSYANAITFYKSNCSDISSDPSTNIILIGIHRNHLTIIDRRFWVFEIERTLFIGYDFRILFGKMYTKMPIQKLWPHAYRVREDENRFEKLRHHVRFGWIWSEYNLTFAYQTKRNDEKLRFFSYDLASDRWHWNVTVKQSLATTKVNKDLVFISNMLPNRQRMWLIRYRRHDRQILMARYDSLKQWYFLCSADLVDDGRSIDNVTIGNNSCTPESIAPMALDDQPIIKAFQTHTRFFFITNRYVYYVSSSLVRSKSLLLGIRFQMQRKEIEKLFICEPSILQFIQYNPKSVFILMMFTLIGIAAIIYGIYLSSLSGQRSIRNLVMKSKK